MWQGQKEEEEEGVMREEKEQRIKLHMTKKYDLVCKQFWTGRGKVMFNGRELVFKEMVGYLNNLNRLI